ncbi:type 1 glutamine amidotransferase domain-containing protein [Cognatilysobacter segetis]|uniref:type 1 glutamine amidotransferase domain-containing protein n=1 Tax=Cognatilysobacter segetis TaxID=2492394 RepID=UPI00105B57BD|nr:type 1 glutamine amidotransferase domain-containing protein [Lysobacter segetis]
MAKRIAILATDGFEQSELTGPRDGLKAAGFDVQVISPKGGEIKGWKHTDWGDAVPVDLELSKANADDYDALVLPGGQMNPDSLRMQPAAGDFVRAFADGGKTVAAICHGPWLLVESGVAKGREVTSWPSVKTDLVNAGAKWTDAPVVVDGNIITSRKPDDIPAFTDAVIKALQ